jgi:hypothetical protein
MIDRPKLLERLDKATDRAATFAIQRSVPIPVSKKSTLIGNIFIDKNENGLYDILNFQRTVLHKNISVFDIAVIIAQRYSNNDSGSIKKILYLDERFSKFHTDMIHYLHCMKGAKVRHDLERMTILEDKFQIAEQNARNIRNRLINFKIVK